MSEYRKVWVNNFGDFSKQKLRGDWVEHKAVPADAIVIERDALPAVVERMPGYFVAGRHDLGRMGEPDHEQPGKTGGDLSRDFAYAVLAVADYLDAHPPIDEAMVEALADDLRAALGVTQETVAAGHLRTGNSDDIARRLIEQGWSKPEVGR